MRVGYQGESYSYSHRAGRRMFPGAELVGFEDFASCFAALASEEVERLVLPVENSTTGPIMEVAEVVAGLQVLDEFWMEIRHALLGVPGTPLEEIKRVLSHPEALAQAEHVLQDHGWEAVAVVDTAGAARAVADQDDATQAALAPVAAAEPHGLGILMSDVVDTPDNATRFVAVSSR